jgi:hypothetical protein
MIAQLTKILGDIADKTEQGQIEWSTDWSAYSCIYTLNEKKYKLAFHAELRGCECRQYIYYNLYVYDEKLQKVCQLNERVVPRDLLDRLYRSIPISNQRFREFLADYNSASNAT